MPDRLPEPDLDPAWGADEVEECNAPDWCRCEECWNEAYDMGELDEDEE